MTESGGPQKQGGFIIPLPYLSREGGEMTGMAAVIAPWGGTLASGIVGSTAVGEPWLGLINDSPTSWLRPTVPLSAKEKELLHLQRLATDCRTATGHELYDAILEKDEPPDFRVTSGGQAIGFEMREFAIEERRRAQGLFFEVTSRLATQQRHRISHLCGYQLYMWFGSADDPAGLPFKEDKAEAYDELVEAIVRHRPNPTEYWVQDGEMPPELHVEPVREVTDVRFFAVPLSNAVPDSPFSVMTGIHASLAFQSDHTSSSEWTKLRKAIERKDRTENDALVISAGAPDIQGRSFVSEEILADFLISNPESVSAENLKSIILHFWGTGRAVELLGESGPKELWPALYQGAAPPHRPFKQPDTVQPETQEPC